MCVEGEAEMGERCGDTGRPMDHNSISTLPEYFTSLSVPPVAVVAVFGVTVLLDPISYLTLYVMWYTEQN